MSGTSSRRLATVLYLGSGVLAGLVLTVPAPVKAEKVGVAAAVKPDAFSEGKQVEIGNSVFYNQRINTAGEGLVQVLLVDGSTFTVGPGSDLVIDKFVYDPSKGKGEVVASFGKGVMRFVGGKLSKNEGGVTVNTPSGALAIRGGMFQLKVQGHQMLASFLFGVEMTIKNGGQFQRIYQPGYTYDNGNVRPTTPQDTATFMKALSGGGRVVVGNPNSGGAPSLPKKLNTAEIEEEGTQSIIIGQLNNEEHHIDNPLPKPPSPPSSGTEVGGYAGGMYVQYHEGNNNDSPVGALASANPGDVVIDYDDKTQTFKGATLNVFASQGGGARIEFVPYQPVDNVGQDSHLAASSESFFAGEASVNPGHPELNTGSISIFHETDTSSGQPLLTNPAHVNYGGAALVNLPPGMLCEDCQFLKWGAWGADVNFDNEKNVNRTTVNALGHWVTGDMTSAAELGDLRNSGAQASYSGKAYAEVINDLNNDSRWRQYAAWGDLAMDWNFGQRKGTLQITNFDSLHINGGGLSFNGNMTMPGSINKFSGGLSLTSLELPPNLSDLQGFAQGSFVKGPNGSAQGVMGNWNVGNNHYGATGIFAGSKGVPQ